MIFIRSTPNFQTQTIWRIVLNNWSITFFCQKSRDFLDYPKGMINTRTPATGIVTLKIQAFAVSLANTLRPEVTKFPVASRICNITSLNLPVGRLRLWVRVLLPETSATGLIVIPQFLVSPRYLKAVPFYINDTHSFTATTSPAKINEALPVLVKFNSRPGVTSVGFGAVIVWPAVVCATLKFEQTSTVASAVPIEPPVARFAIIRLASLTFSLIIIVVVKRW